jgi:hypothetical protein
MQVLRIKLKATLSQLNGNQTLEEVKKAAQHIWLNTIFASALALCALCCAIFLIATQEDTVYWFRLVG